MGNANLVFRNRWNDEYGEVIREEFKEVGVNTTYLEVNNRVTTTNSMIIVNTQTGSRTTLTYRPEEIKMEPVDLDFKPDIILTDGQEIEQPIVYLNNFQMLYALLMPVDQHQKLLNYRNTAILSFVLIILL